VEAGKHEEAIPCLEKALQLNANLNESLYYLGVAYMHIGNNSMAYSYFSRFKITPSYGKLSQDAKFKLESYLQLCKPSHMN